MWRKTETAAASTNGSKKNNICQTPVQQNAQSSFPRVKTKQKTPHVQNGKSKQSRITRAKIGPKRNSNKVRKNKKCDTDIAWCIGFLKQPLRSMATFHHIVTAFFLSSTRKKKTIQVVFLGRVPLISRTCLTY